MKKLEQFYNLILQERTHMQNEILKCEKLSDGDRIEIEKGKYHTKHYHMCQLLAMLETQQKMIDQFKFLYSDEIEVIDGNCREFNISMKEFGI